MLVISLNAIKLDRGACTRNSHSIFSCSLSPLSFLFQAYFLLYSYGLNINVVFINKPMIERSLDILF